MNQALTYKDEMFVQFTQMKELIEQGNKKPDKRTPKSKKTRAKTHKHKTNIKGALSYTRRQIESALKKGEVDELTVQNDGIEFLLKDGSSGSLVNAQGTIRRFSDPSKGRQLIEQMEDKFRR